jgi:hypothetical protein
MLPVKGTRCEVDACSRGSSRSLRSASESVSIESDNPQLEEAHHHPAQSNHAQSQCCHNAHTDSRSLPSFSVWSDLFYDPFMPWMLVLSLKYS